MVHSFSVQNWYALSTIVGHDFPKKITITDIIWDEARLGVASRYSLQSRQIFSNTPLSTRSLPYSNTFQLAVTYEIDETLYE